MSFSELVDITRLQGLCESFTALTGAVTAFLDLEGNILAATGWQDICTKFHRVHPEACLRCRESDTFLAGQLASGEQYNTYHCRNGLIDVAVPILIDGRHVANFFTGQFFFEPPDRERFKKQAIEFGFDKSEYLAALDRVPIFSEAYIQTLMEFFTRLIQLVGEIGHARKQTEATLHDLRASEERFSLAMDATRDGLWDWDIESDTVYYSPGYLSMLGYRSEDLTTGEKSWREWIHPEDRERAEEALRRSINGEAEHFEIEFRMRHKDGTDRWILGRGSVVSRKEDGQAIRMIGTHTDITERKLADESLRKSEEMLNTVLDHVPQAIFWKDGDGRFLGCNRVFSRAAGFEDPRDVIGKSDYDLPWRREDADAYRADDRKVMNENQAKLHFVEPLQTNEGKQLWVDTSKVPLRDDTGKPFGVLGIYDDITERLEAEGKLRQMEKMNAIGQLAGGIAHDFNNQLAGMMGYSDMLCSLLQDPQQRRYAEKIRNASSRAADLTAKLLAFARKGQYQSVFVDMHEMIREVVEILNHTLTKKISIRRSLLADPSVTRGDPTQLENALLNLAINAADAMNDGGELFFETDIAHLDAAYCERMPYEIDPGVYLRINVGDTGCGIPEDHLQRIFEPFFTTKEVGKGTGMGLSAVYGTVKQHRGAVSVFSELGRGTTFTIYLPSEEEAAERRSLPNHVVYAAKPFRILVVDDESLVRELGKDMLTQLGYQVVTAANGKAGVDYYRDHWREIDLVVLDMMMPKMDGSESYHAMKEINPDLKVLLASGYSVDGAARDLLADGVCGFIEKPFERAELSVKVADAIGFGDDQS